QHPAAAVPLPGGAPHCRLGAPRRLKEPLAMPSDSRASSILVVGLGRFGGQVAASLVRLNHEVLAIDHDERIVQKWSDRLTHVVQADATDEDTLRQLGVQDLDRAIVGIGTDIEASVLTVLA